MAEEPFYRVGGSTDLEYGDRGKLDAATRFAEASTPETPEAPEEDTVGSSQLDFAPDLGGESDPDIDSVLFGPTDYPDRPLTTGMPFGPGSNFSPSPQETEDQFMHRIAIKVLETDAPEDAKIWAARRLAGA